MHAHDPDTELPGEASASAQEDPLAEARRLLAEDEQARMQQCASEIQEVLDRHGFRLGLTPAQIVLTPNLS